MGVKLARSAMPAGHDREDFDCFGPVATKDTAFTGSKLADMGCFKQDEGHDSNKYYHVAVVKSKKTGKFYMYVEYGRTKNGQPSSPQYQFVECSDEADACREFEKQCAEKNTKRGQWEKVGSKERYVPRVKKDGATEDLYVVRYMASRAVGLPAAKNICNQDAVGGGTAAPVKKAAAAVTKKTDAETRKLFRDLLGGTIKYTRSVMVGNAMPALTSITDARDLLQDALAEVKKVGSKVEDQIADPTLKKLTYNLYGMIPKAKALGAAEKDWILSADNIGRWQDDLDAFETALKSANVEEADSGEDDVMQGIPADVEYVPLTSELGKFLVDWWAKNTRNKHGHSSLKIHNLWSINRHGDDSVFDKTLAETTAEMPKTWNNERPMFFERQKERPDRTAAQRKALWNSNTALMFHGTRAVNVPGIIRENLRFPNQLVGVVITGAMFGPGSYFADDWGKSANYCSVGGSGRSLYAGSSGHVSGRRSFMFGCDVILGNPHVAKDAHGFTSPPTGHHCVYGKAGHTASWGSYGGLQNNEWIIYRKGRQCLRYLAELSWY
jgi:predicted DNA-binding WGR domain protein